MKTITLELDDHTADLLIELAAQCTAIDKAREGATTHGALSVEDLLAMLANDCALMQTRPGSWEGSNMATVFASHGYEV